MLLFNFAKFRKHQSLYKILEIIALFYFIALPSLKMLLRWIFFFVVALFRFIALHCFLFYCFVLLFYFIALL